MPESRLDWLNENRREAAWVNEYALRREIGLTTADFADMDPEKIMFFSTYMVELAIKQQHEAEKARRDTEAKQRQRRR